MSSKSKRVNTRKSLKLRLGKGPKKDRRSTQELFAEAIKGRHDDEEAWNAVWELRRRADEEVYKTAMSFCNSDSAKMRQRGLDVFAQFGRKSPADGSDRLYLRQRVNKAIELLNDKNKGVVSSAAWALAHLRGKQAAATLIKFHRNKDSDVREAVAHGLSGTKDASGVRVLIRLMNDKNKHVRDWATFGLRDKSSGYTPQIRRALRKRLKDNFFPAREEALWALANRRDRDALLQLADRLDSKRCTQGDWYCAVELLKVDVEIDITALAAGLRKLLLRMR